jgi:hypothetical protein
MNDSLLRACWSRCQGLDGEWLLGGSTLGVTLVRASNGEEVPVRALLDLCCVVIRR